MLDQARHMTKRGTLRKHAHAIFSNGKKYFPYIDFDILLDFAQNIDCGYTLEPPPHDGSNEYPQSMIWTTGDK